MASTVFKSELQADWGMGLVMEEGPDFWVLYFENGGRRKFIKSKTKGLVPVTLPMSELNALKAKSQGRQGKAAMSRAKPKPKSASTPKKVLPKFATFAQQLAFFEKLFPGGFLGDAFVNGERGADGAKGKLAMKTGAMALAQEELSAARFDSATTEELFDSATRLLKATTIVFPIEGSIPFGGMKAEHRADAMAGLKQLLHTTGDYGARLERFVHSIDLKDKKGNEKTVSWPLATVFAALYSPKDVTCVKPSLFAMQAATLGTVVEKAQPVSGRGYSAFHDVAVKVQALLVAAGQKPRDMMDVYSFMWRTHSEKATDVM